MDETIPLDYFAIVTVPFPPLNRFSTRPEPKAPCEVQIDVVHHVPSLDEQSFEPLKIHDSDHHHHDSCWIPYF